MGLIAARTGYWRNDNGNEEGLRSREVDEAAGTEEEVMSPEDRDQIRAIVREEVRAALKEMPCEHTWVACRDAPDTSMQCVKCHQIYTPGAVEFGLTGLPIT